MRVTDEQLAAWTRPAFGNEEQRAEDTEAAIRAAVSKHHVLSKMNIRILPKGSIKNRTNVRRDSDIDVAVIHKGYVVPEYTGGATMAHANLSPYRGISAADYKAMVGEAIRAEFGGANVDGSGNRVFRVRGSQSVMDADVIPSTQYWYIGPTWQRKGIALILDKPDGRVHYNYPDQHYDNGVAKNLRTGRRYKSAVRIVKNIENRLVEEKIIDKFPSYLIECLAYNVPDPIYNTSSNWRTLIEDICLHVWGYVKNEEEPHSSVRWKEVNGHKWLFGNHQRWNKSQAATFIAQVHGAVT